MTMSSSTSSGTSSTLTCSTWIASTISSFTGARGSSPSSCSASPISPSSISPSVLSAAWRPHAVDLAFLPEAERPSRALRFFELRAAARSAVRSIAGGVGRRDEVDATGGGEGKGSERGFSNVFRLALVRVIPQAKRLGEEGETASACD